MTASAARSARARRGRVMIVGDAPELAHMLGQSHPTSGGPLRARNLYDAMGELTTAPAGAPITSLVVSARSLPTNTSSAIDAIRKIDPALRIVVIAPAVSINAGEWNNKGIDECIASPVAPADLGRIFDDDAVIAPPDQPVRPVAAAPALSLDELRTKLAETERAPIAPPAADQRSAPVMAGETVELVEVEPLAAAVAGIHSARSPKDRHPNEPSALAAPASLPQQQWPQHAAMPGDEPGRAAPGPPASRFANDLGDSDLVDAIISQDGSLKRIALQIIAQQTGWADVAIAVEGEQDAGSVGVLRSAPLKFQGHSFGRLTSIVASELPLSAWADWLARWLALDERHREFRTESVIDGLTGAFNRRFFERFLARAIADAAQARRPVTVMVFDIDNFKPYNDAFGHEAGDEILSEIVRLLRSVIRQGDRVCRIGGDEFAVIFADPEGPRKPAAAGGGKHPESIEVMTRRFQDQVCSMRFPKLGPQAPGSLSISAGLATFPWDGGDPQTLLRRADQLALESKRKGKNAITFGPGAQRVCGDETT